MTIAAVGLGSNLHHRLSHLQAAVASLGRLGRVKAISPLYETAPVGGPEQGPFLNAVVLLETDLGTADLLASLQQIERAAGRSRGVAWGPRTLDLDLLLYGDERVSEPGLQVPHPRLAERRFALQPLAEVWPEARLPAGPVGQLLEAVAGQDVRLLAWRWAEGTPEFADRGETWVTGQTVLFVLWAAITVTTGRPSSPRNWIGWLSVAAMAGGLFLVLASWRALGTSFTPLPAPAREGHLIAGGPYRIIRHPIYAGVVAVLAGASGIMRSWPGLVAAGAVLLFFAAKVRGEERHLDLAYPGYSDYRAQVPHRFIPGLW